MQNTRCRKYKKGGSWWRAKELGREWKQGKNLRKINEEMKEEAKVCNRTIELKRLIS